MTADSNSEMSKGVDQSSTEQAVANEAVANSVDTNQAQTQENGSEPASGIEAKGSSAAIVALKKQALMKQATHSKVLASNFGNIVTVLMQSPAHKNLPLKALPDLLVTPIVNNQFLLAEAYKKDTGFTFPVGVVLWARVSDEVDRKLAADLDKPIILTQDEWASGENFWLIETVGEKRFVQHLLAKLCKEVFKDKPVKTRVADADGNRRVEVFNTGE